MSLMAVVPDAVQLAYLRRQVAVSLNGAHNDRPLGCVRHHLVPGRRYAGHGLPPSTVRRRRATTAGSARARRARGDGREWPARLAARPGTLGLPVPVRGLALRQVAQERSWHRGLLGGLGGLGPGCLTPAADQPGGPVSWLVPLLAVATACTTYHRPHNSPYNSAATRLFRWWRPPRADPGAVAALARTGAGGCWSGSERSPQLTAPHPDNQRRWPGVTWPRILLGKIGSRAVLGMRGGRSRGDAGRWRRLS